MRKCVKALLLLFAIVLISVGCSNGVENKNVSESENIPVETPCVSTPAPTNSPELVAEMDALLDETTNTGKCVDLDSWVGIYYYVESFPHFEIPDYYFNTIYSVDIYNEGEKYFAEIYLGGWQADIKMRAKVEGNDETIDIIYMENLPTNSAPNPGSWYD